MKKIFSLFLIIFLLGACQTNQIKINNQEKKNIILVIADGTGPNLMTYLMEYARLAPNSPYKDKTSNLEKIFNAGKTGIVFNYTATSIVSDSAAAATQFATGVKTKPESLGVSADGKKVNSILYNAKQKGMSTGVLTDVYVLDATPAAFYAHQQNRKMRDGIIEDMTITQPDIVLGGGLNYFVSKKDLSEGKYKDLLATVPYLAQVQGQAKTDDNLAKVINSGYNLAFSKQEMNKIKEGKILGLFAPIYLPPYPKDDWQGPSLLDMTKKAISVLSKNEKGFFLLVEAGFIDWVAHVNDPQTVLQELLEFDEKLGYIKKFADKNKNTLVIVSADHDTGSFNFAYLHKDKNGEYNYHNFDKFNELDSGKSFVYDIEQKFDNLPKEEQNSETIKKLFKEDFGFQGNLDFLNGINDFMEAYKKYWEHQGIFWAYDTHTHAPLFVTFYGDNSGIKNNIFHNTDLFKIMNNYLKK